MGLVVSPDIDLRLFLGVGTPSSPLPRRHRGYPAQHPGVRPAGRGGAQGVLTEASDVRAWEPLVERLRAAEQDAVLALREPRAPAASLVDAQIDAAALREGWAALKDTIISTPC